MAKIYFTVAINKQKQENFQLNISPNPCQETLTISYSLSTNSDARIAIFNEEGSLIKTLINGNQNIGIHQFKWDIKNSNIGIVSSGTYFAKLYVNGKTYTQKFIIIR